MLSVPLLFACIDIMWKRVVSKITLVYFCISLYLAITQSFFCMQYGENAMWTWNYASMIYFVIYVSYNFTLGTNYIRSKT